MTRSSRRGPWLAEEDHALMELVRTQGPNNWVRISQQLQHRSPKQCRERYHQNLKPSLNHEPISAQEGELIEQMVHEMGKRWAEIARRLGNRSDNAVKNWWNGSMNRRKRNPSQHHGLKHVGNRLHPLPLTRPERSYVDLPPLPPYVQRHHSSERIDRWPYPQNADVYESRAPPLHGYEHYPSSSFSGSRHTQPSPTDVDPLRPKPDIFSHNHRNSFPNNMKSELPPLRLPLPHTSQSSWPHCHPERALVSPAVSETSQAPSTKQEPSLISDNQSTYSISPRTVTSPRSGLPMPMETNNRSWASISHAKLHEPVSLRLQSISSSLTHDDGYSSALSNSGASESKYSYTHMDPSLRASGSPLTSNLHSTLARGEPGRDTRMTVSNLLD